MNQERFRQRFSNFNQSYLFLKKILDIPELSDIERTGLIKAFEISFELAWKVLKDHLNAEGYQVQTPRDVIKQAFQIELIENGELWLQALEDRNFSVHMYDEKIAQQLENLIRSEYSILLDSLHEKLAPLTS